MRRITRRGFLQRLSLGTASALAGAGAWLSCGTAGETPTGPPHEGITPEHGHASPGMTPTAGILLPTPNTEESMPLHVALSKRRSVRSYSRSLPLALTDISQLFWAAQGVTRAWGGRTSPSAGALYPLELYAAVDTGVYHYLPQGHGVETTLHHDVRQALWSAGLRQAPLAGAPAVFVLSAVSQRTRTKYGDRAERYVYLEAGHAAQNLLLEAVALGLGAVVIGAFHDTEVSTALGLAPEESPIYLIPVGHL